MSTLCGVGRPDGSTCSDVSRPAEFCDTRTDNMEQSVGTAAVIGRDITCLQA